MDYTDYAVFLPRRLSHSGCIVASTQLATQHEALKKEMKDHKTKLSPRVDSAVTLVLDASKTLAVVPSGDATMIDIDRGTDRCIAAYHDVLDAIQRSFDHTSLLPLTPKESERLADATLVRGAVLPRGTAFLKQVYTRQWAQMSAMVSALAVKDVTAAVERLGLTLETDRFRRWAELYGAKLGLTEVKQADPSIAGVQAWHDAYGELFVHVHSEYADRKDTVHARVRSALLSPYTSQADEERRAEQKAKARQSKPGQPSSPDA